jgi:hypothetical protein
VASTKRLARTNLWSIWKTLIIDIEEIDNPKRHGETIMHGQGLGIVIMSIGRTSENRPSI